MSFGFAGRRVFALCPIASVLWAHSVPSDGFGNRKLLEASELPAACHNNDLKSIYHKRALEILTRFKETSGCPGISVCVSLSGRTVFDMGMGYSDVENLTPVRNDTVFRIASISKSLTSLLIGRLFDQRKLSLDDDIRTYVPEFPEKQVTGKQAKITVRTLMNHTSGIRGYKKTSEGTRESDYPEMLLTTRYENALDACELFKADPLVHAPGSKYTYSTFGYSLLSAAIEKICSKSGPVFDTVQTSDAIKSGEGDKSSKPRWARLDSQFSRLFTFLHMDHTSLEYHEKITSSRAVQYRRDSKGVLENTPMIDNSYKWAGGGILSTAPDLIRLANHLAYIYMDWIDSSGVISRQALDQLWTASAVNPDSEWQPGLGWFLSRRSGGPVTNPHPGPDRLYVRHTGGAIGGTTVLLLSLPYHQSNNTTVPSSQILENRIKIPDSSTSSLMHSPDMDFLASKVPPICVAVLTNLENASGISQLATALAELFTEYASKLMLLYLNGDQAIIANFPQGSHQLTA
ncbi:unnamed protein product [Calicophoron daubneyi]|uniref:Beta-lactamase-related domain-containing protein n=1 Tax=Calicophoron daubneyi TaxID=300641 RepID=A0AAV2TXD3_CALDB